jgi:hypothetical protein
MVSSKEGRIIYLSVSSAISILDRERVDDRANRGRRHAGFSVDTAAT